MSLSAGTRLGPYEIQSALGAGGMGEVYRALDTKLGREVAIKVLPSTFAVDPDRLARFEREARLLASLNHPHIAQIYGPKWSISLVLLGSPTQKSRSRVRSCGRFTAYRV
jgi:serine/threonine protein kinase